MNKFEKAGWILLALAVVSAFATAAVVYVGAVQHSMDIFCWMLPLTFQTILLIIVCNSCFDSASKTKELWKRDRGSAES